MAVVQLNDPDPTYWIVVYAVVASIPAARAFDRRLETTSVVGFGLVLAGLLIAGPGFIDYIVSQDYASITGKMMADKPYVEAAREFIGLLMASACLVFYARSARAAQAQ